MTVLLDVAGAARALGAASQSDGEDIGAVGLGARLHPVGNPPVADAPAVVSLARRGVVAEAAFVSDSDRAGHMAGDLVASLRSLLIR